MKVLVIEDNMILWRNLVRYLSARDISSDLSMDWKNWLYKASMNYYDVVILDINLPEINWIEICKKLREKWKDVAIIMLTSMWTNDDIVSGLDSGADDYLVKPFEYNELLARINALTRRKMKNKSTTTIKILDSLEIDLEKHEALKDSKIVKLSKLEYNLLKYLSQNKGKALSRQEIYENVWWEFDWEFMFSKVIDVYIWYLRKKLWKDLIETKKWYWFIIK
jgi:two-component system copper resistance phosphate regulon response regulator CusR